MITPTSISHETRQNSSQHKNCHAVEFIVKLHLSQWQAQTAVNSRVKWRSTNFCPRLCRRWCCTCLW